MEQFFTKYETSLTSNYSQEELIRDLNKWYKNLEEEGELLNSLYEDYKANISETLQKLFKEILLIVENHKFLIDAYIFFTKTYDFDPDNFEHFSRINFLREYYNKILIIIQQLFSSERRLMEIREKHPVLHSKTIIKLQKDFEFKLASDVDKIKCLQNTQKKHFNSLNNLIYPSEEQMGNLFEKFHEKVLNDNHRINHTVKYVYNPRVKEHLLSKKKTFSTKTKYRYTELSGGSNTGQPYYFEMKGISEKLKACVELYKEIKEKADNYCLMEDKNAPNDFSNIKNNTHKINDTIEGVKSDIKDLVRNANEISEKINIFENNAKQIKAQNEEVMRMIIDGSRNF